MQVDFVTDILRRMRNETIYFIEPRKFAEEQWYTTIQDISNATLFTKAVSWYMGSNIPGKKREQLNYLGGLTNYMDACREGLKDWSNFSVKKSNDGPHDMAKKDMPVVR